MNEKLSSFFRSILNAIYPELCVSCEEEYPLEGNCFCFDCMNYLPFTHLHNKRDNAVEKHFWGRVEIEKGTALLYFHKGEKVQEMMHALKYKKQKRIGLALGDYYGKELMESGFLSDIDIIVPIPIHKTKLRKRGYNQSSLIASRIAKLSGIPWSEQHLIKASRTPSQTEKNRLERFNNLRKTFEIKKTMEVEGKHVLLVDDILTTGSTLEAASLLLKENNAKVSIAVLATGNYQ